MAPQHMKLMEGDEINVTEDTLVKAGYNLNPEQLEAMRKKAGRLISIRFFGEESDRAFSFTSIDNRKSKIDALLIQSRGTIVPDAEECERCKSQPGPFEHCMRWKGYFYNCCGNCKWHDMANSCELDKRFEPVKDLPPPVPERTTKSGRKVQAPALAPGMAEDPMGFTAVERRKRERSQERRDSAGG
ncbi:unnamed protein product [Zymoseptoria tritici ST99CH_1A5]|uniref:Uncharacterized protein n=2 Tax=Zymoseptoria tritici TaxID=1047171 RepID=A0A1Y6M3J2_ZYMTR|nr:unnamed protein product [Zymoseptoria tritici ST99CH_1E4]SMY19708.1 unnamed protein product [Zymoseptoria tritici ST99CH_1A5]SMR55077.1 unnamed protein product [Zymoseptoria tritici ST99CH_1E4]SMR56698.1 unnamed protein product [Zymoseptoria tritici ST99CH_1E4]SMR58984.1 unnamed protein product [Zymoseptoria tritici ST99CH_1E4]